MNRLPIRLRNGLAAVPWGFVGWLVLVGLVERFASRNDVRFTTPTAANWKCAAIRVPSAARADVICFGDSLVQNGIVPGVLEQTRGLTACNLAIAGSIPPAGYVLLERLFRAGAKPKAVLLDGELLGMSPLYALRAWPELANSSELIDLAWTGRDPDFLARALLARWLLTYRARSDIRASVVAAFDGRLAEGPGTLAPTWRNLNINQGALVQNDRNYASWTDKLRKQMTVVDHLSLRWSCHPINDVYVRRFLDLTEARGIPVYWLILPLYEELETLRETRGWDAAYASYLRGLQTRYPHLTVLDGRRAHYPPAVMVDVLHLSRTGAIHFSGAVGASLGAPSTSRWVELPPYSEAISADLVARCSNVEDIEESGRAFRRRFDALASQSANGFGRRT